MGRDVKWSDHETLERALGWLSAYVIGEGKADGRKAEKYIGNDGEMRQKLKIKLKN